ncbi:MAG: hypothetical protein WCL50_10750 [Spirochaetota bacterium]
MRSFSAKKRSPARRGFIALAIALCGSIIAGQSNLAQLKTLAGPPPASLDQYFPPKAPAQIGPAMGAVGGVCGSCHLAFQVKVQQQYHWKNFDDVKLANPVTGQTQKLADYMTVMAGAFDGVMVDLQEGQVQNARGNFQTFSAQFQALGKDACVQCHVNPRRYYVDGESMALVASFGDALSADKPDMSAVGALNQVIGNSICFNCHLVHMPAQIAKDSWETFADILK